MAEPRLLLTRPAEEAARTAEAARRAGFEPLLAPLLEVMPLPWETPDPAQVDALLFTSARAPALAAGRAELRDLPACAVGPHTADAARKAGFRVVAEGLDDGSAIVRAAGEAGLRRLLHLGGEATAPLTVPGTMSIRRVPVYAATRVAALPPPAREALAEGEVFATLLFSARTAAHFALLLEGAGLARAGQRIIALSPKVADAAGPGWAAVAVAARPGLDEALVAARALWQGSAA